MTVIHHLEEFMKTMRMIHKTLPKNIFNTDGEFTPLQLEALLFLHMNPKSTVSTLGKYLQLSSSAAAQFTDRLVKTGLLKREDNPQDRRSVLLSLTPKGDLVFSQMHRIHMGKIEEIISLMPEKDVKELHRIFSDFFEKIEARKGEKQGSKRDIK